MRASTALVIAALAVVGCHHRPWWNTGWEPYSSVQATTPLTGRAVRFYEGDVGILAKAGGKILGTLSIAVKPGYKTYNGYDSLHEVAAHEAADRGGTHFAVGSLRDDGDTSYSGTATPNGFGGASFRLTPEHHTREHAEYIVLRVPLEAWYDLPGPLVPAPLAVADGAEPSSPATSATPAVKSTEAPGFQTVRSERWRFTVPTEWKVVKSGTTATASDANHEATLTTSKTSSELAALAGERFKAWYGQEETLLGTRDAVVANDFDATSRTTAALTVFDGVAYQLTCVEKGSGKTSEVCRKVVRSLRIEATVE